MFSYSDPDQDKMSFFSFHPIPTNNNLLQLSQNKTMVWTSNCLKNNLGIMVQYNVKHFSVVHTLTLARAYYKAKHVSEPLVDLSKPHSALCSCLYPSLSAPCNKLTDEKGCHICWDSHSHDSATTTGIDRQLAARILRQGMRGEPQARSDGAEKGG